MEIKGLTYSKVPSRHFASDNNSPVHPDVMRAITEANKGHAIAYGCDYYTEKAIAKIRDVFGQQCEPFFVYTGTGANVLSIATLTRSYEAVICAAAAHINSAECGGPEKFAGVKLYTIPSETGKIGIEDIRQFLNHPGDQHHNQPKVISLTQATDFGLCYTVEEITEICEFAHENDMYVHIDGARIYTACEALGISLKEMTADTGLDVLSLGGTKNGLMGSEAVLFFKPDLAEGFKHFRKQGMQLACKMRYLAVQMETLLSNDLWLENARNSNRMAKMLAGQLGGIKGIEVTRKVQTNMVYCIIPHEYIDKIREHYLFYVFDEARSEVRLVTNYDTTEEDIREFAEVVKKVMKESC